MLVIDATYMLRAAAVCLQLSSFLPSATPLPELKAIATGSFAGMTPHIALSPSAFTLFVSLAVISCLQGGA